ncbi:hypothetical protein WR25_01256 [Diploscapter pachys]|uniref:UDP-xylose and UDP-N-acetylglucosamine transporter n=1 Tax=Diploscapter pachys TaxID=2018661 RepID=A0A2A2LXS8_9BILA|nr:hypothetical protein WR25_01256 [Diploscapter pachys]
MSAVEAIVGTLGSCMGCMIVVENIAKKEPSSMNLMTFATFFFIASQGLIFTSRFFTQPNKIPLRGYRAVIFWFFIVNVINNQALNYHVPVPLHIIFRSGSLLASLVLTKLLQGKNYSYRKYVSVIAITLGIVICTLATSHQGDSEMSYEEASKHFYEWCIGISMLTFALLASAYMAICQERMYAQYGKHPTEAMFVTHFAALPFFALMGSDILRSAERFSQSPHELFGISVPIPNMWLNLLANCVLQYYCIKFVYQLTSEVESLTVTLVVTLRKFLSLIVSIWWFQNPFTFQHWVGATLVFAGTLAFADIWDGLWKRLSGQKTIKETKKTK